MEPAPCDIHKWSPRRVIPENSVVTPVLPLHLDDSYMDTTVKYELNDDQPEVSTNTPYRVRDVIPKRGRGRGVRGRPKMVSYRESVTPESLPGTSTPIVETAENTSKRPRRTGDTSNTGSKIDWTVGLPSRSSRKKKPEDEIESCDNAIQKAVHGLINSLIRGVERNLKSETVENYVEKNKPSRRGRKSRRGGSRHIPLPHIKLSKPTESAATLGAEVSQAIVPDAVVIVPYDCTDSTDQRFSPGMHVSETRTPAKRRVQKKRDSRQSDAGPVPETPKTVVRPKRLLDGSGPKIDWSVGLQDKKKPRKSAETTSEESDARVFKAVQTVVKSILTRVTNETDATTLMSEQSPQHVHRFGVARKAPKMKKWKRGAAGALHWKHRLKVARELRQTNECTASSLPLPLPTLPSADVRSEGISKTVPPIITGICKEADEDEGEAIEVKPRTILKIETQSERIVKTPSADVFLAIYRARQEARKRRSESAVSPLPLRLAGKGKKESSPHSIHLEASDTTKGPIEKMMTSVDVAPAQELELDTHQPSYLERKASIVDDDDDQSSCDEQSQENWETATVIKVPVLKRKEELERGGSPLALYTKTNREWENEESAESEKPPVESTIKLLDGMTTSGPLQHSDGLEFRITAKFLMRGTNALDPDSFPEDTCWKFCHAESRSEKVDPLLFKRLCSLQESGTGLTAEFHCANGKEYEVSLSIINPDAHQKGFYMFQFGQYPFVTFLDTCPQIAPLKMGEVSTSVLGQDSDLSRKITVLLYSPTVPDYEWNFDEESIGDEEKFEASVIPLAECLWKVELQIKMFSWASDGGTYQLSASNEFGTSQIVVPLMVDDSKRVPQLVRDVEIIEVVHDFEPALTLVAKFKSRGQPKAEWSYRGPCDEEERILSNDEKYEITLTKESPRSIVYTAQLLIKEYETNSNGGLYMVRLTNSVGTVLHVVDVDRLYS